MIDIEICCNSRASAEAALAGGAWRIELCRDLECGGLTPSAADIDFCVNHLGLRTYVLVRSRPGDFTYTADELEEMLRTIRLCADIGATGVVCGCLDPREPRRVSQPALQRLVDAAAGMEFTFHRAFDEVESPLEEIRTVERCGCTRVLTSGCAASAPEGAATIRELAASSSVGIMAGAGVTPANVGRLILDTGVAEVHASCKMPLPGGGMQTSADEVRRLIAGVRRVDPSFTDLITNPTTQS